MAEQAYFNRYPNFEPDPQATLIENFDRLTISNGWQQNSKKFRKQRKSYMRALADDHIVSIERGGATEKLAGLQKLCEELRVSPIPTSITQCKNKLETVHVCIIDLIDCQRLGTRVHVFRSHSQLQQHVTTEKHYFPKDEAKEKADGLLRVLLRTIRE